MIFYIIKSSLCLLIVYSAYKLFLEKEKMHQANRWYLMAGLLLSFLAPLLNVGIGFSSISTDFASYISDASITNVEVHNSATQISQNLNVYNILLGIYLAVLVFMIHRFMSNINALRSQIRENEKEPFYNATLILCKKDTEPFSFFKYIFLNRRMHLKKELNPAIYTHELIHVRHFHSVDIVLIEILKSIFWFNPILKWYKTAIQLNHEFIADEMVLNHHQSFSDYPQLIVDQANMHRAYLTSNLSFLNTKKRLKMMSKQTSRSKANLYVTFMIPFFIGLLMLFGQSISGQETQKKNTVEQYYKDAVFAFKRNDGQMNLKFYSALTPEQKASLPIPEHNSEALVERTLVYYNAKIKTWEIKHGEFAPPPPTPPAPLKEKEIKAPAPPAVPATAVDKKKKIAPEAPAPPSIVAPSVSAEAPPPPPPPPPMSLDKILAMDAEFYLDDQKINREEAKQLMKRSESEYSVNVQKHNQKKTKVILKKIKEGKDKNK